jgi:hypothetical protein
LLQRRNARSDLIHLTTRAWDHLFPTRGFQRSELAWCPPCLAEDKIAYHRLAWLIQPVRVCHEHKVVLQQRCAKCGRSIPVLHERSRIVLCPWCGGDPRCPLTNPVSVDIDSFDY